LVATLSSAPPSTILMNEGYRTGYEITKHVLSVGAGRAYEPGTSFARHCFSVLAAPWFEPLEDSIHESQLAREGLIRGGDLQIACLTYQASQPGLLDSAPTMDSCAADVEAALAFAARTGNDHDCALYLPFRQLPKDSVTASDLVAVADIALYEAKMGGRDQVRPARWSC